MAGSFTEDGGYRGASEALDLGATDRPFAVYDRAAMVDRGLSVPEEESVGLRRCPPGRHPADRPDHGGPAPSRAGTRAATHLCAQLNGAMPRGAADTANALAHRATDDRARQPGGWA